MPHVIPTEPRFQGGGARAEEAFLRALVEELPEDWWVYCNLPYYDMRRAGMKRGEIDFLLLHRERGMLLVECKGEGVKYDAARGEWYRVLGAGSRGGGGAGGGDGDGDGGGRGDREGAERLELLGESPVRQAERGRHDLVSLLEETTRARFPEWGTLPFVHAHAVAFPLVARLPGPSPTDLPPELCFTASDRGQMLPKVESILERSRRAIGRAVQAPPRGQFDAFRKHVLRPSLHLAPGLGAQVLQDGQTFVRLSEAQVRVVQGWMENPVLRVRGGAGTGKTVLALEAARARATLGDRVLLLCFNKFLGSELGRRSEGWGRGPEDGSVHATHFHGLCEEAARRLGRPFEVPRSSPEEVSRFWNDTAPEILWEALLEKKIGPFDTLVVDEAQDFCSQWWTVLESAFAEEPGPAGRLILFYDPSQDIFNRRTELPAGASLSLLDNFRNTRKITEAINRLGVSPVEPHYACPIGEAPEIRTLGSPKEAQRALDGLLRRMTGKEGLLPDQITILTTRKLESSSLGSLIESPPREPGEAWPYPARVDKAPGSAAPLLGGHRLSMDPDARAGALLFCNVHAFKGLESEVVILIDVDPRFAHSSRLMRYVGSSRARHLLHVLCEGDFFE